MRGYQLQDGNGSGDKIVLLIPPETLEGISGDHMIDVEGVDTSGDVLTIIKKGEIDVTVVSDITRV